MTTAEKRNPFSEIERMGRQFWRNWPSWTVVSEPSESWAIPLDVEVDNDKVTVIASLPGIDPSKIDASVEDGVLSISAQTEEKSEEQRDRYVLRERRAGSFHRAVRLPESVNVEAISSEYKDGLLKILLPRQESKKARKIVIS